MILKDGDSRAPQLNSFSSPSLYQCSLRGEPGALFQVLVPRAAAAQSLSQPRSNIRCQRPAESCGLQELVRKRQGLVHLYQPEAQGRARSQAALYLHQALTVVRTLSASGRVCRELLEAMMEVN